MNIPNCVIWTPVDGGWEVKRIFRNIPSSAHAVTLLGSINEAAFEPLPKPVAPPGLVPHEARHVVAAILTQQGQADDLPPHGADDPLGYPVDEE